MPVDLAQRGPFAAADHQDLLGARVQEHGGMDEGLVVEGLVVLGGLDAPVEDEHEPEVVGLGDRDLLEGGRSRDQDPADAELVAVVAVVLVEERVRRTQAHGRFSRDTEKKFYSR